MEQRSTFFFSSRRRHTRFDCDWSSDVCSSDLAAGRADGGASSRRDVGSRRITSRRTGGDSRRISRRGVDRVRRSEERRVGKEGRSRGSADQRKKKEKNKQHPDEVVNVTGY